MTIFFSTLPLDFFVRRKQKIASLERVRFAEGKNGEKLALRQEASGRWYMEASLLSPFFSFRDGSL
jgi:hypothetical protein